MPHEHCLAAMAAASDGGAAAVHAVLCLLGLSSLCSFPWTWPSPWRVNSVYSGTVMAVLVLVLLLSAGLRPAGAEEPLAAAQGRWPSGQVCNVARVRAAAMNSAAEAGPKPKGAQVVAPNAYDPLCTGLPSHSPLLWRATAHDVPLLQAGGAPLLTPSPLSTGRAGARASLSRSLHRWPRPHSPGRDCPGWRQLHPRHSGPP